ncbi:MAG TPA: GlsB/YeaQ/YmgE family stress response membrane protein [Actinomycetota bacterium]|nr:GlsB/YeaQ/YmgE family stress response membrane protein [Actinomycetota bacterium]
MEIVAFILIGLVVGILARLLMPGTGGLGILATILVGIVGAIVGGYAWRAIFGNSEGVEWIGSILTAMVLLWALRRTSIGNRAV